MEVTRDLARIRGGATLGDIENALVRANFAAAWVSCRYHMLREIVLPAIALVNSGAGLLHFVVVFDASKRHVVVADPAAAGVITMTARKFRQRWDGPLLVVSPRACSAPNRDRHPGALSIWRDILGGSTCLWLLGLLYAAGIVLLTVAKLAILRNIIAALLYEEVDLGYGMLLLFMITGLMSFLCESRLRRAKTAINEQVQLLLQSAQDDYLVNLVRNAMVAPHSIPPAHDLPLSQAISKVSQAAGASATILFNSAKTFLFLAAICWVDWRIGLLAASVIAGVAVVSVAFCRRFFKVGKQHATQEKSRKAWLAKITTTPPSAENSHEATRVEGRARLVDHFCCSLDLNAEKDRLSAAMSSAAIVDVAILALGGYLVMNRELGVGELLLMVFVARQAIQSVIRILDSSRVFWGIGPDLKRVQRLVQLFHQSLGREHEHADHEAASR